MKRVLLTVLALLMVMVPVTAAGAEEGAAAELSVSEELMVGETPPALEEATNEGAGQDMIESAVKEAISEEEKQPTKETDVFEAQATYYDPNIFHINKPTKNAEFKIGDKIEIEFFTDRFFTDTYYPYIFIENRNGEIIKYLDVTQTKNPTETITTALWDTTGMASGKYFVCGLNAHDKIGGPWWETGGHFEDRVEITLKDPRLINDFVTRLYTLVLNRTPASSEVAAWANQLSSGQNTGADAAYGFFFSDEMMKRKLSNGDYVDVLYKTLMGRNADAGGKSAWLAAMGRGENREQIFAGFVNSAEFAGICAAAGIDRGSFTPNENAKDKYQIQDFVNRLYSLCLGRSADGGGLNGWTDQLMSGANTGTQAAHGFFFSAEMEGKNLSPGDYVEVLYKVMLNRNADGGGKAAWVRLLEQGQTREEIFYGFANSPEFDSICRSYGIVRGTGGSQIHGNVVYWVDGGDVYHQTRNCATLSRSTNIHSGTAEQSGKSRACKVCG